MGGIKMDVIKLNESKDFLKCVRNELRPENKKTGYGLVGLLHYKMDKSIKGDPDSMYVRYNTKTHQYEGESYASKLFKEIYGDIEESSDTIFNCWSFFRMFQIVKVNQKKIEIDYDDEASIEKYLEELFVGFEDVKVLLDKLANLHHSLANMMPAIRGYNGCLGHDGKGNWKRDNDMPDIYYKRCRSEFPKIYSFINENMDKYCLSFFYEYNSPWTDGMANRALDVNNIDEVEKYKKAIKDAIYCIEKRADYLFKLKNK